MTSKISHRKQRQKLNLNFTLCIAICFTLMFFDIKNNMLLQSLRSAIVTVLQPVEYLLSQPFIFTKNIYQSLSSSHLMRLEKERALKALSLKAFDASREEWLLNENKRLRELLNLSQQLEVKTIAVEVLQVNSNPFQRKIQINHGTFHDVQNGDIVIDEKGVVGQVVRAYLMSSEVRLITDQEHNLPVQNLRTGTQSILYGISNAENNMLELRYITPDTDIKINDLLVTSGNNNIYIPGIPVASITSIENDSNTPFVKVYVKPISLINNLRHLLIVKQLHN